MWGSLLILLGAAVVVLIAAVVLAFRRTRRIRARTEQQSMNRDALMWDNLVATRVIASRRLIAAVALGVLLLIAVAVIAGRRPAAPATALPVQSIPSRAGVCDASGKVTVQIPDQRRRLRGYADQLGLPVDEGRLTSDATRHMLAVPAAKGVSVYLFAFRCWEAVGVLDPRRMDAHQHEDGVHLSGANPTGRWVNGAGQGIYLHYLLQDSGDADGAVERIWLLLDRQPDVISLSWTQGSRSWAAATSLLRKGGYRLDPVS